MNTKIYSVSQINTYIRKLIGSDILLQSVWVEGEISNLKRHPSGHIYMSLKDSGGTLRAVMFSMYAAGLRVPIANGTKILAQGSLNVYERDGTYQLLIRTIRLSGMGELYQAFELQKKKLEALGYFDPAHRKEIPAYAFKIGIVTASSGAAIQDIVNISRRRNPYVQLILYPAVVQGEAAAPSLVKGIRALDEAGLDVIIVGRGGGSMEDLWAFNEESVVQAVYEARTPIISAVGHETDTCLTDLAADRRAPTPSAAAELAVFDYQDYLQRTAELEKQLGLRINELFHRKKLLLTARKAELERYQPARRLLQLREKLGYFRETARMSLQHRLAQAENRLKLKAAELERYSPLTRLSGGYAFVENDNGKAVASVRDVQPREQIRLHLKDGKISARVEEITENESIGR